MGFLRRSTTPALAALMAASASALADVPPLVTGIDAATNGSAGAGSVYSAGGSFQIRLGSEDDESNNTGDFHLNYTDQISPIDPTNSDSALKNVNNWTGGTTVNLSRRVSLGLDLDTLADSSELLNTDGAKLTVGVEPIKVSYRFARNILRQFFQTPGQTPSTTVTRTGAFIYQHGFELDADLELTEDQSLELTGAYSLYTPNAPQFADLVNNQTFAAISQFQDTLQTLELWSVGADWKAKWSRYFDTDLSAKYAHLIIASDPSIATTIAAGVRVGERWHIQLGWDYNWDPSSHTSTATLELKYSWDRGERED